jgi:putative ABC transport system permease protein
MSRTSTGSGWRLLLRWSGRDLRARWLQVAAIALVIGLGTGSYAGLSNVTRWRIASMNDAYDDLSMYDVRVRLAEGSTVAEGSLLQTVQGLPDVEQAEERLLADIQVDASTGGETILVPGILYGVQVGPGLPAVNGFSIEAGRGLVEADRGQPVVLLEHNFARHYNLPAQGEIRIGGGQTLRYVGQALTPEFFIVTNERGGWLAEANYAAIFSSLQTVQGLLGREGAVNDVVIKLREGADRAVAAAELEEMVATALPGSGATVMTREEDPSFKLNKADVKSDQRIYNIFAALIFAGAIVAAFNLISRLVDSQRREIGLSMVLGVLPARIAVRPLLVAAEIALLGAVLGVVVSVLLGLAMAPLLRELLPLPEWQTPFFSWGLVAVAAGGFLLPFLATVWPVARAVSVPPIQAIQSGYRSVRSAGLAPLLYRLPVPGNTFLQVPARNVVRSPRRSLLTIVGIAAALAALLAFVGLIDSFVDTIDRGRDEILSDSPDRLEVTLNRPYPEGDEVLRAILGSTSVAASATVLRLEGVATNGDDEVPIQLDVLPLDSPIWAPHISEGSRDRQTPGIYLSELAARDLDADIGSLVTLRHPRLTAAGSFELVENELPLLGVHPHPFRFIAYMDANHAGLFNVAGAANVVQVVPAEGVGAGELKQELFSLSGVTSVQGVGEAADMFDDILSEFIVILRIVEGVMLLLALLIAFNAASISIDERAREHATMFAFGVPVRTVMRMAVLENLILGIFATAVGLAVGYLLLRFLVDVNVAETLPDVDIRPAISDVTLVTTIVLGILAVALAPLLTWRRLRRMDIPSTLKVFE